MLRRADNCKLVYSKRLLGKGKLYFHVGKKIYDLGKCDQAEVDAVNESQMCTPYPVMEAEQRTYWRFKNRFYWDNDDLTADQVNALLLTRMQRERATVERAEAMVAGGLQPRRVKRGVIPDDAKQMVWLRDGGKCQRCGRTEELQFDHIIPVALGGSDSVDNIQVLCGSCNRTKGAGITTGLPKESTYLPPAGWYDDPEGSGENRYWDGNQWTEHIH